MTTRPDFKFGDRVIHIGESQKRGVVSRVFRSGGVWWLAFEGEPDWRYSPRYFRRLAQRASGAGYYRRARLSASRRSFRERGRLSGRLELSSAARSGSRRGACGNRSSSMARRPTAAGRGKLVGG